MVYSARKKFGIKGFAAILTLGACLSIPVGRYRREFHFREGRHREPILRYRYRNGCTRENHSPRFSDFRLLRQAPRMSTLVCATAFSLGWSDMAEARRIYITPRYACNGWSDYAARNGIACVPGSAVKGGDDL